MGMFDINNKSLCIVSKDNLGFSVWSFTTPEKQADDLQRAIESNKKDIETWMSHILVHGHCERFSDNLKNAQEKSFEVITFAEFNKKQRDDLLGKPLTEINAEQFDEALNCLPPEFWCTIDNIEMFCMSEMWTATYTSQFAHDKTTNKFYCKMVDCLDRSTWINEILVKNKILLEEIIKENKAYLEKQLK